MIGVIRKVKGKDAYFLDGKQVSKKVFDRKMNASIPKDRRGIAPGGRKKRWRNWPMVSDAMAVHFKQLPLARKLDKARGAPPTEYTKQGQPIWTSEAHKRAFIKAHGVHDNNSYL
jgi:hypothetical protein